MFTGIIECMGEVKSLRAEGTNMHFTLASDISDQLKIDQSVSHDGACLTVIAKEKGTHTVTAVEETLKKTTLGNWEKGSLVNLERCMLNNGRFDGHIVQGHVDVAGKVVHVSNQDGSWLYTIEHPEGAFPTVEKGSITVNGISLTCFDSTPNSFKVAIIPYTYEHTNIRFLKPGDLVNLEFDIIGKYVKKILSAS